MARSTIKVSLHSWTTSEFLTTKYCLTTWWRFKESYIVRRCWRIISSCVTQVDINLTSGMSRSMCVPGWVPWAHFINSGVRFFSYVLFLVTDKVIAISYPRVRDLNNLAELGYRQIKCIHANQLHKWIIYLWPPVVSPLHYQLSAIGSNHRG